MQNNGNYVTQGHRFWYQLKAYMQLLLVINTDLQYILSVTVFKLLQIIGQICTSDRRVPLFNTLVRGKIQDHKIWPWKRNITLSSGAKCAL